MTVHVFIVLVVTPKIMLPLTSCLLVFHSNLPHRFACFRILRCVCVSVRVWHVYVARIEGLLDQIDYGASDKEDAERAMMNTILTQLRE